MRQLLTYTLLLFATMAMALGNEKFVLVIDAGHGGHDAGAVGAISKEKNINLKTALAFGRYVEQNCPDVKVIYTRKTDVFIPLHQRADIANKNHADVFISIHTNSLPAGKIARGFETYTMGMRRSDEKLSAAQRENSVITYEQGYQERYAGYDPNSPESAIMFEFIHDKNMSKSVELAKLVQKETCSSAGCLDKGVKQDVFLVLRETSMPACLIELGFISTADEESKLNNDSYIDKLARGIFSAFLKYKDKNSSTGVSQKDAFIAAQPVAQETKETKEKSGKKQKEVKNEAKVKPVEEPKVENPKGEKEVKTVVAAEETVKNNTAETPIADKKEELTEAKKPEAEKNNEPAAQEMATQTDNDAPVYKVQILTGPSILKPDSPLFKGLTDISHYRDGAIYKYTVGSCASLQEASALKKSIADKFPDAFIVAFMNGERVDLSVARQYKKRN